MKDIDPKQIPVNYRLADGLRRPYRVEWSPHCYLAFMVFYEEQALESFETWAETKDYIRLHAQFHPKGQYRPVYFDELGLLNNGE